MLEHNIGPTDRTLRFVTSLVLLLSSTVPLALHAELIALAPAAVGLVTLVTAVTGRSPLYSALRTSTLRLTRVDRLDATRA